MNSFIILKLIKHVILDGSLFLSPRWQEIKKKLVNAKVTILI